jgi:glycosyltransferase involved in cell wall biosynthesis
MGIDVKEGVKAVNKKHTKSDHVKLLMVGTIEPRKNYEQVLEWFQKTKLRVHLDIVGRQGWKCEEVKRAILSFENTKHKSITWHKNLSDNELEGLYRLADIGVCASKVEGFGIPLRDFLARNLNVVASDIPPFQELLQPSNRIHYFELGDAGSLENAIQKSLSFKDQKFKLDNTLVFPSWDFTAKRLIDLVDAYSK